jgi:hypothetical protein
LFVLAEGVRSRVLPSVLPLSVHFLVAQETKSYEILGGVIAEVAPGFDVMELKIFRSSAKLAPPAVSFQNFAAELAVSFNA